MDLTDDKVVHLIRQCALKSQIRYTEHAIERMSERGIMSLDVNNALKYGELIETQYQTPPRAKTFLFQEYTKNIPNFYAATCYNPPPEKVIVVSVCKPNGNCWAYDGKKLVRH